MWFSTSDFDNYVVLANFVFRSKNVIFRSQNWLFRNEKVKNVTKIDPKPIPIVLGSFLNNLGWDKTILVKTIFRHISDPKSGLYETKKWSDAQKRCIVRRRLASSTLLQILSTIGILWVLSEQLWHPKRFLASFRSQNGKPWFTRALYRSIKRRSESEIDEKLALEKVEIISYQISFYRSQTAK